VAEWDLIRRRDTTRLIYDILCIASRGSSKYGIISKANLRFSQAETYLSFLLDKGHLQSGLDGNGVKRYMLTAKGETLRVSLAQIQEQLDGLNNSPPGRDTLVPSQSPADMTIVLGFKNREL